MPGCPIAPGGRTGADDHGIARWEAAGVGKRGGQLQYSDVAIETALEMYASGCLLFAQCRHRIHSRCPGRGSTQYQEQRAQSAPGKKQRWTRSCARSVGEAERDEHPWVANRKAQKGESK